ncbi:uncharacterized protein TRAVEDRAFT_31918 [Trametes versicolor FP-101664 SS1]|uniref:uncharacterized protein n=1 Tax=Trametes versicolor (strain FP-101664) TaxID=717944 RepID=UPI0004624538|nr:uncharacterized protein TRAVEDRAFT_31918 [Trametes versicolor FP-101664 SS1]EIW52918.1 hypothetical protein TRAVEDRAFT_31918 [Trametes versicolor FP-101664 SS1]
MANLAAALLKLERWDLAQSAAGRALYHDPKNKKARFRRAMARKHLKRYYGAKLDLQKFMYLDMTKMNEEGFREFQILDELQAQGDEVEWPLNAGEGEADEEEEWVEVEELLDPEEYKRASDAGPCREYNHEGCSKGDECPRGHTPMEVITTRDELGRNVCMYWLLDTCEKGDACEYAHDKTYLPPSGWWTDEKRQGRIREHIGRMVALAGRPYPGVRLLMDLNPKPWFYEPWALYPYAPTTEERKAWERRGNWPPKSYIWGEMSYYEVDPSDPNAIDQLESRRRTYDNA